VIRVGELAGVNRAEGEDILRHVDVFRMIYEEDGSEEHA
jgi:hypothetical protein